MALNSNGNATSPEPVSSVEAFFGTGVVYDRLTKATSMVPINTTGSAGI